MILWCGEGVGSNPGGCCLTNQFITLTLARSLRCCWTLSYRLHFLCNKLHSPRQAACWLSLLWKKCTGRTALATVDSDARGHTTVRLSHAPHESTHPYPQRGLLLRIMKLPSDRQPPENHFCNISLPRITGHPLSRGLSTGKRMDKLSEKTFTAEFTIQNWSMIFCRWTQPFTDTTNVDNFARCASSIVKQEITFYVARQARDRHGEPPSWTT